MTADELRAAFDAPEPLTIGLEEEAMLLDPRSADLAPVAAEVIQRARREPRPRPPAELLGGGAPKPETPGSRAEPGAPKPVLAAWRAGLAGGAPEPESPASHAERAGLARGAPEPESPASQTERARLVGAALKPELPASQVELVTAPGARVGDAIAELAAGRRALAAAASGIALPAAAGAHPFAAPLGELGPGERYDAILAEYGDVARAQLVCALQVHVAVGGAERTLAVYNALRGHLPEVAALAANAPFLAGRDTGLASVRPLISGLLPRQGVPPALPSWEAFADALRWGRNAGAVPEPRRWWWELRPHPVFGTLELRVPDAQTTLAEAAAVAAFAHALVAWLAERHDEGEALATPLSWRIAENRWTACRRGLDGSFADLATGERTPVRDVLRERLAQLTHTAERLGCAAELASAGALVEANGAQRQREEAKRSGAPGVARWLAERYVT